MAECRCQRGKGDNITAIEEGWEGDKEGGLRGEHYCHQWWWDEVKADANGGQVKKGEHSCNEEKRELGGQH